MGVQTLSLKKRGREEKMDWREELKKQAGVSEEKDMVDLNDVEGREILGEQHLAFMAQTHSENADVTRLHKRRESDWLEHSKS